MTITLNRRLLIGVAMLAAMIVAATTLLPSWLLASSAAEATPEQVAADFARAYYTVDYRDQQAWLDRLQPLMTEPGFAMVKAQFAPAVWKSIAPARFANISEQVSAEALGPAAEGESQVPTPHAWRIERVQVTLALAARWPSMPADTAQLNVLLERPRDDEWKVVTTLSDQSVELFKQRGGSQ